jgi:Flp pilus assembly protein TadG
MKAGSKSVIGLTLRALARAGRRLGDESGGTTAEFMMTATMFFMVIFAIMGFSMVMFSDVMTQEAAREGARYAMVRGNSWKTDCTAPGPANCIAQKADIESYVKATVTANADNLHVDTTWLTSTGAGCGTTDSCKSSGNLVKVTATYSYTVVLPFLPNRKYPISSTAQTTIAQ